MNLETKITIYKFTPQLFTLTHSFFGLTIKFLFYSNSTKKIIFYFAD